MCADVTLISYEAQDNYFCVIHIRFHCPCEYEAKSTLSMVQLSRSETSLKPEHVGMLALRTLLTCISVQFAHMKLTCLPLAQFAYSVATAVCQFPVETEWASPYQAQEKRWCSLQHLSGISIHVQGWFVCTMFTLELWTSWQCTSSMTKKSFYCIWPIKIVCAAALWPHSLSCGVLPATRKEMCNLL